MKKILLIILFIQISVPVIFAQDNYMPFVKEGKTWVYPVCHILFSHDVTCTISGDTIIGECTYKKMYSKGLFDGYELTTEDSLRYYAKEYVYYGAIRETDKKVFFIPNGDVKEYLLYDFGLNKGDKLRGHVEPLLGHFGDLKVGYGTGGFVLDEDSIKAEYTVQGVDSVVVSGIRRKRIRISGSEESTWKRVSWIEGIGAMDGFICPFEIEATPFMANYDYGTCLSCYEGKTRIYGLDDYRFLAANVLHSLPRYSSYDFEENGIFYMIISDSEVAVTYKDLYVETYTNDTSIPENVEHNGISYQVTSVADGAFFHCLSLQSVSLPESIHSFGSLAFAYCRSLKSFSFYDNNTSLGDNCFEGCHFNRINIKSIKGWCESGWQKQLDHIDSYKLYCNDELISNLVIPDDVSEIADSSFYNCTILKSIDIPASVRKIGKNALHTELENLTIHCDIEDLSDCGIYWLQLQSLTIYSETPPVIDYREVIWYTPSNYPSIYVPSGCGDRYRAAEGWKNFPNIIEMEGTDIEDVNMNHEFGESLYDLQGRRLKKAPQQGVYIRNGKKVVVK